MNKSILALIFSMFLAAPMFAADLGGRVISIGSDTTYPPHEFIEESMRYRAVYTPTGLKNP